MKTTLRFTLIGLLFGISNHLAALPLSGKIFNDGDLGNNAPSVNFSLIHELTPSGSTLYSFDRQPLDFNLFLATHGSLSGGGTITLNGPQTLTLDNSGSTFTIKSFNLNIIGDGRSDPTGYIDAFGNSLDNADFFRLFGDLDYQLVKGATTLDGTFNFANQIYSTTAFNSATLFDNVFSAFLWGADDDNQIGIDIAFSGQATIFEPPVILLLLMAAIAFIYQRVRADSSLRPYEQR